MGEMQPIHYSIPSWLDENSRFFLPPVCNKMMHNNQLKVFFVGGPNQRKDFHLEEGEELFYMRKGDMELLIMEHGVFRTIRIKEGDIFLLPGKIPHSPQRYEDTVGLVIERERLKKEKDGLRYFIDGKTDILFERWFYCDDLGVQLKPIIEEFFDSEEYKTGKPGVNSVMLHPPWVPDSATSVADPFNLQDWLDKNRRLLRSSGQLPLFAANRYQSDVLVLGYGDGARALSTQTEVFFWQLEGSATVANCRLRRDDTLLVPSGSDVVLEPTMDSLTLYCSMNPDNKKRPQST